MKEVISRSHLKNCHSNCDDITTLFVMELKPDRNTSMPKSVLRLLSGLRSGALIWNWASTALVPQIKQQFEELNALILSTFLSSILTITIV